MWATSAIFKILPKVNNRPLGEYSPNLVTLNESYDRELQRQRCKNLQRHGWPIAFSKHKDILLPSKNALAYYI
jgi:hypothetical protein